MLSQQCQQVMLHFYAAEGQKCWKKILSREAQRKDCAKSHVIFCFCRIHFVLVLIIVSEEICFVFV